MLARHNYSLRDVMNEMPEIANVMGHPELIQCSVGGFATTLMIDSGSFANTISQQHWTSMMEAIEKGEAGVTHLPVRAEDRIYAYAAPNPLRILARFRADVRVLDFHKPEIRAEFVVVEGARRSLLGRLSAKEMGVLRVGEEVSAIEYRQDQEPFPSVPNRLFSFDINDDIQPSQQYYYKIPLAFEDEARVRLTRMLEDDIIERVTGAPTWVSGLNVVMKGPNDFRLTLNMKKANRAIRRPFHALPSIEMIRTKVAGARKFSKLDLHSAFHHCVLDEKSRAMTAFMTEFGLFRFKRLVFGVVSAPEMFQRFMEEVLLGIENVIVYIDDILVYATTEQELQTTVGRVEDRLRENKLSINTGKCEYDRETITFLGHTFSERGMNIDEAKVAAVTAFREPATALECKSFLGLANFVRDFIPNFTELTSPLRAATADKKRFVWKEAQSQAFKTLKETIAQCSTTLAPFVKEHSTALYTDASGLGLGAVLTQQSPEGQRNITAHASRALTATEARYDQNQRELLAMVWGTEHFYYYLLGRHFELITDSAGSKAILDRDENRARDKRILTRTEGWINRLAIFTFTVSHVAGTGNIADAASRLGTLPAEPDQPWKHQPGEIANIDGDVQDLQFSFATLSLAEVAQEVTTDGEMGRVRAAIETGEWGAGLERYEAWADLLRVVKGVIVRGDRVVIPERLRSKALARAHDGHPGMTNTKKILRERVWWPGMDRDVEKLVEQCNPCFLNSGQSRPAPMRATVLPRFPFDKVAVDHNGPIWAMNGKHVLVMIDYYSRYMFARIVDSTSMATTIESLDEIFQVFGWPNTLRSDNGPAFAGDFKQYCRDHDVTIENSMPLDPQQNGLVERAMTTINKALDAARLLESDYAEEIERAVKAHNAAPNPTTRAVPEVLMFGRHIKRALPMMRVDDYIPLDEAVRENDRVSKLKTQKRTDATRHARDPSIGPGDVVVLKNTQTGKLDTRYNPRDYTVLQQEKGDLRLRETNQPDGAREIRRNVRVAKKRPPPTNLPSLEDRQGAGTDDSSDQEPELRRSRRTRKRPDKLKEYVQQLASENP